MVITGLQSHVTLPPMAQQNQSDFTEAPDAAAHHNVDCHRRMKTRYPLNNRDSSALTQKNKGSSALTSKSLWRRTPSEDAEYTMMLSAAQEIEHPELMALATANSTQRGQSPEMITTETTTETTNETNTETHHHHQRTLAGVHNGCPSATTKRLR